MISSIPNADLLAAAAIILVALAVVRFAYRRRRPKFLYGAHQSVAMIQQARRAKTFEVREDLENRHFSPSA
jgi:hypothetical protein